MWKWLSTPARGSEYGKKIEFDYLQETNAAQRSWGPLSVTNHASKTKAPLGDLPIVVDKKRCHQVGTQTQEPQYPENGLKDPRKRLLDLKRNRVPVQDVSNPLAEEKKQEKTHLISPADAPTSTSNLPSSAIHLPIAVSKYPTAY